MKILPIILLALSFAGCATNTAPVASTTASHRDLSEKRVHTQEELLKTGRPEVADALQTVDASVSVSHGR